MKFPGLPAALESLRAGLVIDAATVALREIRVPRTESGEAAVRVGVIWDGRRLTPDQMLEVRDGSVTCMATQTKAVVQGVTAGGSLLFGLLSERRITWFPSRRAKLVSRQFEFLSPDGRVPLEDVRMTLVENVDGILPYSWMHAGLGPSGKEGYVDVLVSPRSDLQLVCFRNFGNHVARSAFRIPAGTAAVKVPLPTVRHLLFDPILREDIREVFGNLSQIHVYLSPANDDKRSWSKHVLDADSQLGWSLLDSGHATKMECVIASTALFGRCLIDLGEVRDTYRVTPVLEPCPTVDIECDANWNLKGAVVSLDELRSPWGRAVLVRGRKLTLWDPVGDASKVVVQSREGRMLRELPIDAAGGVKVTSQ